ncbi:hypothetical protein M9Y10_008116 [Tritrichomonas musculus]|uniref:DUF3447 domain-containing protein n=1 Tax=Tritrichomonas musculus TaxID=1915356 RepID=A0ABR2IYE0_9EUKA
MEVEKHILKRKELQTLIISYIENDEDDENFQSLTHFIEETNFTKKISDLRDLLSLLSAIANNHQRCPNFFNKIAQIIKFFLSDIQSLLLNQEIYNIFQNNAAITLHFINNKIIFLTDQIASSIKTRIRPQFRNDRRKVDPYDLLYLYLYYESNNDTKNQAETKQKIIQTFHMEFDTFLQLCLIGENDLHICELIRQDSLNEFISYINETSCGLNSKIPFSPFEKNNFLMNYKARLIEYAAFFGSIQIFKYLQMNKVGLRPALLDFAVHGRNSEMIHIIEENVKFTNVRTEEVRVFNARNIINFNPIAYQARSIDSPFSALREAIRCHHNDIADYIEQNNSEMDERIQKENLSTSVKSYNYEFIPDDFNSLFPLPKNFLFHDHDNAYGSFFAITKITLPSSVTEICDFCFYGFNKLNEVIIPSSVTSIGINSFKKCTSLSKVSFENPSSLKSIENSAFNECSSLLQFSVPSSVVSIGEDSFKNCSSLVEITFLSPSSLSSIGNSAFVGCSSLKRITIPKLVDSIGDKSFKNCSSLVEVAFETPSSLPSIGISVFDQCSSLKQLTIPSSVTSIENYAFRNCSSLVDLTIPSSVTSIGKGSFENCSELTQLTLPSSITSINSYSFQYCSHLTELTISSSVTQIGDYSFRMCLSLKKVTIPSSVTEIGKGSFEHCSSLTQVTIPSSITNIKDYTFSQCSSLKQISIPSSVASIGNYSFYKCSALAEISIPSSVTQLGNNSFAECSSLLNATISPSITQIKEFTFYKCKLLKNVTIPSSVTEIGSLSFCGCSSLEQLEIPSSVTKIGDFAFSECKLLSESKSLNDEANKDEFLICIQKAKELYFEVLKYLDNLDDVNDHLLKLLKEISEDEFSLIELLNLLDRISMNHHGISIEKVGKILSICKEKIQEKVPNNKICQIFKQNKKVLLFLIENHFIKFDRSALNVLSNQYQSNRRYHEEPKYNILEYLKPEIKQMKSDSSSESQMPDDFFEKRKIGQNDSEICDIIRNDMIEEFIHYIQNNLSNDTDNIDGNRFIVPPSIYETNPILENSTFIQYAAFYGSLKIFNYLYQNDFIITNSNNLNGVDYALYDNQAMRTITERDNEYDLQEKQKLWKYAIYGNQLEIIHLLEENDIKPEVKNQFSYYNRNFYAELDFFDEFNNKSCFDTAIKCHHNEIANYIKNNYELTTDYLSTLKFSNFTFFDDFYKEFADEILLLLEKLCLHDFPRLAYVFIKSKNIDCDERFSNMNKIINASIKSNNEIAKYLLEGQDNIIFDEDTLFMAIFNENTEIVKLMLSKKSNVDVNKIGYIPTLLVEEHLNQTSPLFLAIINRNMDIIKLLINHPSINVNLSFEPKSGRTTYRTALHIAIVLNDIPVVKLLLNHPKINVNAVANFDETTYGFLGWSYANHFDHYYTPLHEAIELNNVEVVRLLLSHPKIAVNRIEIYDNYENSFKDRFDRVRQSALCRAIQKQSYEIVKLLLEHPGIDVNIPSILHKRDSIDPYYHNQAPDDINFDNNDDNKEETKADDEEEDEKVDEGEEKVDEGEEKVDDDEEKVDDDEEKVDDDEEKVDEDEKADEDEDKVEDEEVVGDEEKVVADGDEEVVADDDENVGDDIEDEPMEAEIVEADDVAERNELVFIDVDERDELQFEEERNDPGPIIQRSALQFAYAGRSQDIVQLLLSRNDINDINVEEERNDELIKEFTKDIK